MNQFGGGNPANLIRTLVHLIGRGHLYEGARQICLARYNIEVLRIPDHQTSDPDERVSGSIEPIGATITELFGRKLTLLLEDARKLDFYVTDKGFVISSASIY